MKRAIALTTALALSLAAAVALAHTALRKATPADGSTVAAAPKELVLEFSEPVRLTAVSLASADGKKVDMAAVPADTVARFALPVRGAMTAGDYVVSWRAVGADTHVVSGELKFKVSTAPTAPTASR